MFYSNKLFEKVPTGMSNATITFMVGAVNFGTCFIGLSMIFKIGRKKLMIIGNTGMSLCLLGTGYFGLQK